MHDINKDSEVDEFWELDKSIHTNNKVAQICKTLAVILGVMSLIVTFLSVNMSSMLFWVYLFSELICCLLIYSVGEIIEQLSIIANNSIKVKERLEMAAKSQSDKDK